MNKLSIMLMLGLVSCCFAQPNHEGRTDIKGHPQYERRGNGNRADYEMGRYEKNGDHPGFGRQQGFGPQRDGDRRMGFGPRRNGQGCGCPRCGKSQDESI